MSYSEAKITIDLTEYNDLVKAKKDLIESGISVYKDALLAIIGDSVTRGVRMEDIVSCAKKAGLGLAISNHNGKPEVIVMKSNT